MTDDQSPSAMSAPGHEVMSNTRLSADVHKLVVKAPLVAAARQPGQFVIVRLGPGAERIPLTIAESDSAAGSIVLVIQAVGKSTSDLVALAPGDRIHDVVGPLGRPSDLVAEGTAVCVGRRRRRGRDVSDCASTRRARRRRDHGAGRPHRRERVVRGGVRFASPSWSCVPTTAARGAPAWSPMLSAISSRHGRSMSSTRPDRCR